MFGLKTIWTSDLLTVQYDAQSCRADAAFEGFRTFTNLMPLGQHASERKECSSFTCLKDLHVLRYSYQL